MNFLSKPRLPSLAVLGKRFYAPKQNPGWKGGSSKNAAPDPNEGGVIAQRHFLFETEPTPEERLAKLADVVPSLEVHETIHNAYQLLKRQRREQREEELEERYQSMRKAIDYLKETDESLYKLAVEGKQYHNLDQVDATNARLANLPPRELLPPFEYPGDVMWNSKWESDEE